MQNFFYILIGVIMFFVVIMTALHSIDKITERDCDRGIKSACQYVNK